MKLQNPFDRFKKKEFVPLSLFPANKMTRTTMPIGRAVPVYFNSMIQGNKIKLNVNQLTRFMSMSAPVMNNYQVEFAAFFVPYVSFDSFFTSNWFRQKFSESYGSNRYSLHMREFFNPSTADSLRTHPIILKFNQIKSGSKVGSLYDHLGYPIFANVDLDDIPYCSVDESGSIISNTFTSDTLMTDVNASQKMNGGTSPATPVVGITIKFTDTFINTFLQWSLQYIVPSLNLVTSSKYPWTYSSLDEAESEWGNFFNDNASVVWKTIVALFGNVTGVEEPVSWKSIFGDIKLQNLYDGYLNYLSSFKKDKYDNVEFNIIRWLSYNRIYADWFLNENYINREDYLDMIGDSYISLYYGSSFVTALTAGQYSTHTNTKLTQSPELDFFAKYLRNGECLPVLWNKDRFTSVLKTEAASSVPIGSTISEHYYNRMYARFKDLIARMGTDYKKNTDSLYGHAISDQTLNRSQLIGYRSFDVQIGDVAQTSQSTSDSTLGDFGGYAVSRDSTKHWEWTADENGEFVVLAWVRPKFVAITNACDRSIFKSNYFDYLIPQFGGVGYQDVSYKELYPDALSNAAFGLQERYSEYMSVPNECSGYMRTTLRHYNSDRTLTSTPASLKGSSSGIDFLYMTEKDDLHRVFTDTITDPVLIACYFDGTITRQLPAYIQTEF